MDTLLDNDDAVNTAEPVPGDCSSQGQPEQVEIKSFMFIFINLINLQKTSINLS